MGNWTIVLLFYCAHYFYKIRVANVHKEYMFANIYLSTVKVLSAAPHKPAACSDHMYIYRVNSISLKVEPFLRMLLKGRPDSKLKTLTQNAFKDFPEIFSFRLFSCYYYACIMLLGWEYFIIFIKTIIFHYRMTDLLESIDLTSSSTDCSIREYQAINLNFLPIVMHSSLTYYYACRLS